MDQTNRDMIEQIRRGEPAAYQDRHPVPRVIDVAGRRSGQARPFGINVTALDGRLYLCSATRERDWVKNLMAAGHCRVERDGAGGTDSDYRPVMVEATEAATVLSVYLHQAGYRDPQLPFALDAPLAVMRRLAHLTTVIRLDPLDGASSA